MRSIFRLKEGDRPLASLTPAVASTLYARRTTETRAGGKPIAVDTHHGELRYAKQFCDWCVKRGWLRANPFASIEPVGKKKKGKPKLRVNATRAFLAKLLSEESVEATAVMTALMLGLRANEVVKRVVDDLDDDGWLLWIRDSKTKNSDREVEVPEVLRARLLELAKGKQPDDRLFGDVSRHWLHYHTVRLCEEASVPRVTPHGLRGSGATAAVRMAARSKTSHVLSGMATEAARSRPTTSVVVESARGRRIEELIVGTKRERVVSNEPQTRDLPLVTRLSDQFLDEDEGETRASHRAGGLRYGSASRRVRGQCGRAT